MIPLMLCAQKDKTRVTKKRTVVARGWEAGVTTNRQHVGFFGGVTELSKF